MPEMPLSVSSAERSWELAGSGPAFLAMMVLAKPTLRERAAATTSLLIKTPPTRRANGQCNWKNCVKQWPTGMKGWNYFNLTSLNLRLGDIQLRTALSFARKNL